MSIVIDAVLYAFNFSGGDFCTLLETCCAWLLYHNFSSLSNSNCTTRTSSQYNSTFTQRLNTHMPTHTQTIHYYKRQRTLSDTDTHNNRGGSSSGSRAGFMVTGRLLGQSLAPLSKAPYPNCSQTSWLSPCMVDSAVGVRMGECQAIY